MGVITLLAFGIIGWLLFLGYILPYKLITKRYHSKLAGGIVGTLCAVLIFGVFFGDHIYKKWEYRQNCEKYTKNEVYDLDSYKKFQNAADQHYKMNAAERNELPAKYDFISAPVEAAIYDKKNNYLSWAVNLDKDRNASYLVNLNDNSMIYETINYWGGFGGWLCRLLDFSPRGCMLDSCMHNKLGAFK